MNHFLVVGGKLSLICAIAAFALGVVNAITEPRIHALRKAQFQATLREVQFDGTIQQKKLPEEDKPDPTILSYYPLIGSESEPIGYIVELMGDGYGGDLHLLAGIGRDGEIHAARLLDNQETPGLGKEAEHPEYMEMFVGRGAEKPVPTRKQQLAPSDVDTVTGASITFAGIANALQKGSLFVKDLEEDDQ